MTAYRRLKIVQHMHSRTCRAFLSVLRGRLRQQDGARVDYLTAQRFPSDSRAGHAAAPSANPTAQHAPRLRRGTHAPPSQRLRHVVHRGRNRVRRRRQRRAGGVHATGQPAAHARRDQRQDTGRVSGTRPPRLRPALRIRPVRRLTGPARAPRAEPVGWHHPGGGGVGAVPAAWQGERRRRRLRPRPRLLCRAGHRFRRRPHSGQVRGAWLARARGRRGRALTVHRAGEARGRGRRPKRRGGDGAAGCAAQGTYQRSR